MHNNMVASRPFQSGLSVALQGGGSLGAFTWGVLDALLESGIAIKSACGASAGAVNAVVMAQGLLEGGADGARSKLERFWHRLSNASPLSGLTKGRATFAALEASAHLLSPAQMNPLGIDRLKEILSEEVDFERLKRSSPVHLLISATRVRDGRARIFSTEELSLDVILASACLPLLHDGIAIEDEWYWDGGYSANPPLRELVMSTVDRDVLLIDLTEEAKVGPPRLARDIKKRVNEIALSSSYYRELDLVGDLIALCRNQKGHASPAAARIGKITLHHLCASEALAHAPAASKLDIGWKVLTRLKESGYEAGRDWLGQQTAGAAVVRSRASAL